MIEEEFGYKHISTGEVIRQEKESKSELGKLMSQYDEKGLLVPDEVMKNLIEKVLKENDDSGGIILDGYPRTIPQVDTLFELLGNQGRKVDRVINIDVPKPELLSRAKIRAKTSNRQDDQDEATHFKRIEVFEENTLPSIEYLKTKITMIDIDGMGKIEEITERIGAILNG